VDPRIRSGCRRPGCLSSTGPLPGTTWRKPACARRMELTRFGRHLHVGVTPEEGVLTARPSKDSPEFRGQAVELITGSDKTVAEIARDLGFNDTTLGNWVKAGRAERSVPDATGLLPLTAAERADRTRVSHRRGAAAADQGQTDRRNRTRSGT
jgi:transposase